MARTRNMGASVPKTNVVIRMEEDVKRQVEGVLSSMGLTLTAAINVFVREVLRTRSIPFQISATGLEHKGD